VALLGGNGRRPFQEALSKCLDSPDDGLVGTCPMTAGWLTRSIASVDDATEMQLAAAQAVPGRRAATGSSPPCRCTTSAKSQALMRETFCVKSAHRVDAVCFISCPIPWAIPLLKNYVISLFCSRPAGGCVFPPVVVLCSVWMLVFWNSVFVFVLARPVLAWMFVVLYGCATRFPAPSGYNWISMPRTAALLA
jgi:hypothetical protein